MIQDLFISLIIVIVVPGPSFLYLGGLVISNLLKIFWTFWCRGGY